MDRFTRNYAIGLGVLAAIGIAWWLAGLDFRAGTLDAMLAKDPVVGSYTYPFRVRSVEDGVAFMYTPRSAEMPVQRFLATVSPSLARLSSDDPAFIAAEQELARVQARARSLVLEQPNLKEVRWVLDREWYERRGITP
jgi:hypothetical protein